MSDIDYGELAKKFDALAKSHRQMADAAISAANHMRKLRDQLEEEWNPESPPSPPRKLWASTADVDRWILDIMARWPNNWVTPDEVELHIKYAFFYDINPKDVTVGLERLFFANKLVRLSDWHNSGKIAYKIVQDAV